MAAGSSAPPPQRDHPALRHRRRRPPCLTTAGWPVRVAKDRHDATKKAGPQAMRSGFLKPFDSAELTRLDRWRLQLVRACCRRFRSARSRLRSTGHVNFKHRVLRHWGPEQPGLQERPELRELPGHPQRYRSKPERHRRNHCNDACRTSRGNERDRGTWRGRDTWRDHGNGACDRGSHHNRRLHRHHKPGRHRNRSRHNHDYETGRPKPSSRCRSTTGRRSRKTARSRILTCDSSRILLQVYRNVRVRKTKLAGCAILSSLLQP